MFYPFLGGLENWVLNLAREQAKDNQVHILTLSHDRGLPNFEKKFGFFIHRHPGIKILPERYYWPKSGFCQKINEINPDIIFTHTRFFATSFLAAKFGMSKKIHVEHGAGSVRTRNVFLKLGAEILDRAFAPEVFGRAEKIVVFSTAGKSFVQTRAKKNLDSGKIKIISSGVQVPAKFQKIPRQNRALFFGRLQAEKGLHEIDDVAKKCPNWKFEIAGSGPLFQKFEGANVHWCGTIQREKMMEKIQNADLVLAPSWTEGSSLAVLESAASGRAVLATRTGQSEQIVSPNFLVDAQSASQIIEKLNWLENNFEVLEKEGAKNRENVAKNFSFEKMVEEFDEILQAQK